MSRELFFFQVSQVKRACFTVQLKTFLKCRAEFPHKTLCCKEMKVLLQSLLSIENITSVLFRKCKHCGFQSSKQRSTAVLIDGVHRAQIIQEQLKQEVSSLIKQGFSPPLLTTILVGNDEVSRLYIKRKTIAAEAVGILCKPIYLERSVTERALLTLIDSLNNDAAVHAILVQLPLPDHICERTVCNAVVPKKDVDGFNFSNIGLFMKGMDTIWPCTAMAVSDLIQSTGIETRGKHAVICGRSKNVGLPIAMMLHANGGYPQVPGMDATTTICHRFTPQDLLCSLTKSADILVSAAGVPGLITPSMVKSGACVIDVGISRQFDHNLQKIRLLGDVDFEGVRRVAGFLTPVPGGVGPMTVAMLLKNTLKAARQQIQTVETGSCNK